MIEFDTLLSQEADNSKVYIAYGLVMNLVQECELSLIQTYYAIKLYKGKIRSEQDKSELYTERLKDTFGTLVKILSDQNYLDIKLLDRINNAKKLRDNLAHTFFKENMPEIKTAKGRRLIIRGMAHSYTYISKIIFDLKNEMAKIFKRLRFSDDDIKKFVDCETKNWLLNKD